MARKPDDWMPLLIGKYLRDTTHLTRDQHGAYFLLLMSYWTRGGGLPADDGQLATIAKCTAQEWKRMKPVIAGFFTERDGKWFQKRAEEELEKARKLVEAKSAAGKKGAESKWHANAKDDGRTYDKRMAEPSPCHRQTDAPSTLTTPTEYPSSLRSDDAREARSVSEADLDPPAFMDRRPRKFEPPDWVPREAWDSFVKFRKKGKAPWTDDVAKYTVDELEKLRGEQDIGAVLRQSVQRGWTGVFPIKAEKTNGTGHHEKRSTTNQHLAGIAELIAEGRAGQSGTR